MEFDDLILDDPAALASADTGNLLPITASAGASMRAAVLEVDPAVVGRIVADGRPHSVVVVGGGGSQAAGEILAAVTGSGSPIPVVSFGGPSLPGWVGPTDLVIAVSASGRTPETISVIAEAARRGCRLLGICPPRSPLDQLLVSTRAAEHLGVGIPPSAGTWRARMLMWSLATPLLLVGGELGLVDDAPAAVNRAADQLDVIAETCAPIRESINNPAKRWALDIALSMPLLWGTGQVGKVAVRRFGRQLAENAGLPAVVGTLPDAARTQALLLAGSALGASGSYDIFRDRVDDPVEPARLRLVMLRDGSEHPATAQLADSAIKIAESRGVAVSMLRADAGHPLDRLVTLAGMTDFASVYASLALGADPMSAAHLFDARLG